MKRRIIAVGLALLGVWLLKRHYASANADDLWWILQPTATLVSLTTGTAFTYVGGEGYFSAERLFLIEKSCAGVNFLVAAFGMLVVAGLQRAGSLSGTVRLLAGSLAAGYVAAVAVNSVRIGIAMWLATRSAEALMLSASQVHRIEGVVVYFGGLLLLFELSRRFSRATARPACA